MLYVLAVTSGLRAGELRALTVGHLDAERGGLRLDATWTKNRKSGFQPVASGVIRRLVKLAEGLPASAKLLHVPYHSARELERDMKRAGLDKWVNERKTDFHALRHTYATLIREAGADSVERAVLMRHAIPGITDEVYEREHVKTLRLREIVEAVAARLGFASAPIAPQRKAAGAEGDCITDCAASGNDGASGNGHGGSIPGASTILRRSEAQAKDAAP
jgi:integrase